MPEIDHILAAVVVPLAVAILLSGLDDLFIAAVWIYSSLRRRAGRPAPADAGLNAAEKRIAVFIPLWREDAVIRQMLEHNTSAIRYSRYHVFAGAYPNDDATLDALRECEARFPRVHLALVPHDGPTSKADCLNALWRAMLLWENEHRARFDIVVIHDAEDVVHAEELTLINYYAREFDMVQIPVLPLATPLREMTHGVYCDEFAEYQTKDIPARQALGGFIPSNGVGTGYRRRALEALAAANRGDVFDTGCLTEDYETGYRLKRLGFRSVFVTIARHAAGLLATREFFPRRPRPALRQRTRWVTGIALQCWQRHGWRGGWKQAYWWWRDRKGLVGNLATVLANAALLCGAAARLCGVRVSVALSGAAMDVVTATLAIQILALALRMYAVARIYGVPFALGVPVRAVWANLLNAAATVAALAGYAAARTRGLAIPWFKTDHMYPSPDALLRDQRPVREILVESGLRE